MDTKQGTRRGENTSAGEWGFVQPSSQTLYNPIVVAPLWRGSPCLNKFTSQEPITSDGTQPTESSITSFTAGIARPPSTFLMLAAPKQAHAGTIFLGNKAAEIHFAVAPPG